MDDVKKLSQLLVWWNAGNVIARDEVIKLVVPMIERFAQLQFSKGKKVNTPMLLNTEKDVVQDVAERLVVLHKEEKLQLNSVEHLIDMVDKITYSIIVDTVRKLTGGAHGSTERVQADVSPEFKEAVGEDDGTDLLNIMAIVAELDEKFKPQALAFSLKHFWDMDNNAIAKLLDISERTAYRYIDFSECYIMHSINGAAA